MQSCWQPFLHSWALSSGLHFASPDAHRRATASGVGYSAARYALQRGRGSPGIRMRTRHTGPRRVMSKWTVGTGMGSEPFSAILSERNRP